MLLRQGTNAGSVFLNSAHVARWHGLLNATEGCIRGSGGGLYAGGHTGHEVWKRLNESAMTVSVPRLFYQQRASCRSSAVAEALIN